MSEKRFVVNKKGIFDNQTKKAYLFVAYDWIECEIYEVVELLNEQQATISQLKEKNEQLQKENTFLVKQRNYWKHKVNSLLWILGQFDEQKVKKLLEELDE